MKRPRVAESAPAYLVGSGDASVRARLGALIEVLGNNLVADLLGVNKSQPSRWRRGIEGIAATPARRILELDMVISRLLLLYPSDIALRWLDGNNPHVGGRPIDVVKVRGPLAILPAIGAAEQGAFA